MANDVVAVLVAWLKATGLPVYTGLPIVGDRLTLPAINLVPLSPAHGVTGLNTGGVDTVAVDVEVFSTPADADSGRAHTRALTIRRHLLSGVGHQSVRVADVTRPARRPDKNPHVTCYAMTIECVTPI